MSQERRRAPRYQMVLVKISAGDAFFQAKAQVVYAQPNMGAGVAFLAVEPPNLEVLERWLDEAQREVERQKG